MTHTNDKDIAPSSRNDGLDNLSPFTDWQEYRTSGHDRSGAKTNDHDGFHADTNCPKDATNHNEGTSQGDHVGQPKRQRPRSRNKLGTDRIVVTKVEIKGLLSSPQKATRHYTNALGCILRKIMSINEFNLGSKANEGVRNLLISKVHTGFKFPDEYLVYNTNKQ